MNLRVLIRYIRKLFEGEKPKKESQEELNAAFARGLDFLSNSPSFPEIFGFSPSFEKGDKALRRWGQGIVDQLLSARAKSLKEVLDRQKKLIRRAPQIKIYNEAQDVIREVKVAYDNFWGPLHTASAMEFRVRTDYTDYL